MKPLEYVAEVKKFTEMYMDGAITYSELVKKLYVLCLEAAETEEFKKDEFDTRPLD